MKKAMLFCATGLLLALNAQAGDWTVLNSSDEPFSVQVLQSDLNRCLIHYTVNRYLTEKVTIEGKSYTLLEKIRRESTIEEAGKPRLPRINRSLIIPEDGVMGCSVISSNYIEIKDIDIAPSKGHLLRSTDPETVPYAFADAYRQDAFFPGKIVELGEPYIMRDFRGMAVLLNAFQYNPVSRTLRIYTDVTVEVKRLGAGGENILIRQKSLEKIDPQFAKLYKRHFINYSGLDYPVCYESGGMLVICYDSFMSEMEPFVEWKNQKGIPTTMVPVSQAGSTYSQIQTYIRNYYNANDLCYVLLVGDQAQIPSYTSGSDPVYSLLSGDWYPDIFVGRFSAENVAQVQTQVERTVDYEKYPNAGANWYAKGLGTADLDGPCNPEPTDARHISLIARDLLHWNYAMVDSVYLPWGTTSMISRKLNAGRSIWNYAGHGSVSMIGPPNFSITNVNELVNDNMLPHIVTIACQPGNFQNYTCLAETFLRATNHTSGEPTGAIGCYMSKISQSWFPPYDMQDEGVDLLVHESMVTLGGYCFNGSGLMIDNYGSQGENEFRAWNIFGDPSLFVRSMRPYPLSVTHDSTLQVGATSFDVAVANPLGLQSGAMVCGMNEEIYATGMTDSVGQVTLTFNPAPTQAGTFTLTVTTANAVPYIAEVNIVPADGSTAPRLSSGPSPEEKELTTVPSAFALQQNHPNPFNLRTTIRFALPQACQVALQVFDLAGRSVGAPLQRWYEAGTHEVMFDGTELASGVYVYRLHAGEFRASGKMVLMK